MAYNMPINMPVKEGHTADPSFTGSLASGSAAPSPSAVPTPAPASCRVAAAGCRVVACCRAFSASGSCPAKSEVAMLQDGLAAEALHRRIYGGFSAKAFEWLRAMGASLEHGERVQCSRHPPRSPLPPVPMPTGSASFKQRSKEVAAVPERSACYKLR